MQPKSRKKLRLTIQGRITDHLGIQMYQTPVAAIAELVANAWDADATRVDIALPDALDEDSLFVLADDGIGMTFEECESRYLNVGYSRRENDLEDKTVGGRPILGRKGIGKFAGFGIAEIVEIETISRTNGERTRFELDLNKLRTNDYVREGTNVDVLDYSPPDNKRKPDHGTKVTLKKISLGRRPSNVQFSRSMARRFLLLRWAEGFEVSVNGQVLPESEDLAHVQFSFPRDYKPKEKPPGLKKEDDWGIEILPNGREIRWRVYFFDQPIDEEELRGISVFAKVKLAQKPFFFNLSGGLGGQHGQEYMSGQVKADYIDQLAIDLISPERQRLNWENKEVIPLEEWGQKRIKQLLRIWRDRRGERRRKEIEDKVVGFSGRLEKLPEHERRTIKRALTGCGKTLFRTF